MAVGACGRPVSVACLVAHDMPGYGPAAGLTPWLKGLYVPRPARRQGVGGDADRRQKRGQFGIIR
jgi:hypothetical protein